MKSEKFQILSIWYVPVLQKFTLTVYVDYSYLSEHIIMTQ